MTGERSSWGSSPLLRGGGLAVLAALAFGVTTPLIQKFGEGVGPAPSATLLYAGAALASGNPFRSTAGKEAPVRSTHFRRLLLVALFGAVVAPMCLAWGLQHTSGAGASLLLNFEAVFTVLFAWMFFREPVGRRVALALGVMILGGTCLILGSSHGTGFGWGAVAIIIATLGWALDNTLTRPLADLNPSAVVRWKGGLGAILGVLLSFCLGAPFPGFKGFVGLLLCGATGYGLSLRFYLLAQRRIGAGRTGSIFALAPFVGATVAWAMGDRTANGSTLLAGFFFAVGVYLHLTEAHEHRHHHEPVEHEHVHRHDDGHHDHEHDPPVVGEHSHVHRHEARVHEHPHAPDLHHGHRHEEEKLLYEMPRGSL